MIVNELEINRYNLAAWSPTTLKPVQATLSHNVNHGLGEISEEKLLIKLISIEIKRQIKVGNINTAAEKKKDWTIKHWDMIQRQSEPLDEIKFGGAHDFY